MASGPFLGIVCLMGFPVLPIALIVELLRKYAMSSSDMAAGQAQLNGRPHPIEPPDDARRDGESVSEWVERALASCPVLERRMVEG